MEKPALGLALAAFLAMPGTGLGGDGSGTDNPDLSPGAYPRYGQGPLAASGVAAERLPESAGLSFFELDWSVGLRGSLGFSDDSVQPSVVITPAISGEHQDVSGRWGWQARADIDLRPSGAVHIGSGQIGLDAAYRINRDTDFTSSGSVEINQAAADDPGVADNVARAALIVDADGEAQVARRLGRLGLALRGRLERTDYGETLLDDDSVVDNSGSSRTGVGGGLRASYALTPIVSVFGDVDYGYDRYDAVSSGVGVPLDNGTTTLSAGVAGNWSEVITAELAVGRAFRDFDDASLSDAEIWTLNASVGYQPDETLTLTASYANGFATPDADSGEALEVSHALSGEAEWTVNRLLTLSGSLAYSWADLVGSGDTSQSWEAGLGAVWALGAHTSLLADYAFAWTETPPEAPEDSHTVSLGVLISR